MSWCKEYDIPIVSSNRSHEEYTDGTKCYHTVYAFAVEVEDDFYCAGHGEESEDTVAINIEKMVFFDPSQVKHIIKPEGCARAKITVEQYNWLLSPPINIHEKILLEQEALHNANKKAIMQIRKGWEILKIPYENKILVGFYGRFGIARVSKDAGLVPW